MKLPLNILFLFFSLRCLAQHETKEHFLNAIEHSIQRNCDSGYYLDRRAGRNFMFRNVDTSDLKRYIPISVVNEFLDSIGNDTIAAEWQFDKLNNARILSDSNQKTLYSKHHNWLYISKPIFDHHYNYAIINIVETSGGCHFVTDYVFIREKRKWIKRTDIARGVYCTAGSHMLESNEITPLPIIR